MRSPAQAMRRWINTIASERTESCVLRAWMKEEGRRKKETRLKKKETRWEEERKQNERRNMVYGHGRYIPPLQCMGFVMGMYYRYYISHARTWTRWRTVSKTPKSKSDTTTGIAWRRKKEDARQAKRGTDGVRHGREGDSETRREMESISFKIKLKLNYGHVPTVSWQARVEIGDLTVILKFT